ncbi:MAG: biotin/lipoyl-containing protein, partial [Acidobacteriota bacterium]
MATNVQMPQMGESITEGTIVRWFKQEGEAVKKDEPLLEISTDKVDAEVPSPASGTLSRILHGPGATVAVETVIGVIAGEGEAEQTPAQPAAVSVPAEAGEPPAELFEIDEEPATGPVVQLEVDATGGIAVAEQEDAEPEDARRRTTPLVRRMAAEKGVDLAAVPGTGIAGRVTKADLEAYLARQAAPAAPARPAPSAAPVPPAGQAPAA